MLGGPRKVLDVEWHAQRLDDSQRLRDNLGTDSVARYHCDATPPSRSRGQPERIHTVYAGHRLKPSAVR
jgi:hypothetical protein